ncbi:MAG: ATP-dependent metallopeptidase FtsH/Yme1/Tma family protein, partial [Bacteroidota bacterium]
MSDSKANQKPQQKKIRKPNLNNSNDNDETGVGKVVRSILIWVGIIIGLTAVYLMITSNNRQEWPVSYSEYMNYLNEDRIESGIITKSQLNDFEFHGT